MKTFIPLLLTVFLLAAPTPARAKLPLPQAEIPCPVRGKLPIARSFEGQSPRRSSKWTHFERRRAPLSPRRAAPTYLLSPNDSGPALCRPPIGRALIHCSLRTRPLRARYEYAARGTGSHLGAQRASGTALRAVLQNSSFILPVEMSFLH